MSQTKHLTHLDEEFILSRGFQYGLFDTEVLWKKGSDGKEWFVRISIWQRKISWYYIQDDGNSPPKTLEWGYMTREKFNELFAS